MTHNKNFFANTIATVGLAADAYVLEGVLEYQLEGKPPVTVNAGEVVFIPNGTIHSVKNVGTGNAKELAAYVVEKGKPLIEVIK